MIRLSSLVVGCMGVAAAFQPCISLAAGCESLSSIPGVTSPGSPPIVFKPSDFASKTYGINLRFFYGDWDWRKDFGYSNLPKSPRANEAIADFAARCLTAYPVGRIHTGFLQQTELDRDAYLKRIFDEVVAIKRELLLLQQNHAALLEQFMPPGIDEGYKSVYRENMKKHVNEALLQLTQFVDTHYLYTIEGMSTYFAMEKQLTAAASQIYDLVALIGDVPDADKWAFNMLRDNTYNVLDTYGLFFGPEQKDRLAASFAAASQLENDPDLVKVKQALQAWAEQLEESAKHAMDKNSTYFAIALEIKFLFGTRDPGDEETAIKEIQSRLDPDKAADVATLLRRVPNDENLWHGVVHGT